MRIQLIKCLQDESTVGVKESELEYQTDHFARWVFNNDDQTLSTVIFLVCIHVQSSLNKYSHVLTSCSHSVPRTKFAVVNSAKHRSMTQLHGHRQHLLLPSCCAMNLITCVQTFSTMLSSQFSTIFNETKHFLPREKSQVKGNPCITFGTSTEVKDELWSVPCAVPSSLSRCIGIEDENKVKTKI